LVSTAPKGEERDRAIFFSDLFQKQIGPQYATLLSLPIASVLDLVDETQDVLDELWKQEDFEKAYPESRMKRLLEVIGMRQFLHYSVFVLEDFVVVAAAVGSSSLSPFVSAMAPQSLHILNNRSESLKVRSSLNSSLSLASLLERMLFYVELPFKDACLIYFYVVASALCQFLQHSLSQMNLWRDPFGKVKEALKSGQGLCERWAQVCEMLTAQLWKRYGSHPWKGDKFVPEALNQFAKRLDEV